MKKLAYTIIFSVFAFPFVYLENPKFTLVRVLTVFLLIVFLFKNSISKHRIKIKHSTYLISFFCIILILYRFINDLSLHEMSLLESLFDLLKHLIPIIILILLEQMRLKDNVVIRIVFLGSFIQIIFGLMQIFNKSFTINNILEKIPLIKGPEITMDYLQLSQRISGTCNISIIYSLLLGIFIIIAISIYLKNKNPLYLGYILICISLILLTQTRSAIYGLIPSLFLTYMIYSRLSWKRVVVISSTILIVFFTFDYMQKQILTISPRSRIELGPNTYSKLSSNIYGSYYVLNNNPLFGSPRSKYYNIVRSGSYELGELVGSRSRYSAITPNHNLFGRYLINYGLVGLILIIIVLWLIYNKIKIKKNPMILFMLTGIIIYFIQYSMLHNNTIFGSDFLWVLLSLGNEQINGNSPVSNHRY